MPPGPIAMNHTVYDPRARQWQFPRQRSHGFRLFPAGEYDIVVRPSAVKDDPGASTRGKTKKRWSRCLAQDAPEMGPAMEWIDNYFEESQLLAVNTSTADPLTGRLLAFGAVHRETHSDQLANVAAFAHGETGSDLVLAEMGTHARTFETLTSENLLVPHIKGISSAPHLKFRAPIRQLCFAGNPYQNDVSNPRLGVRTSSSTQVFKVTWQHIPLPGQSTRLALQPLVTVPSFSSSTRDVDISFNPWYDRQFGTIDQTGDWRIWDIEGAYEASRKRSGLTLNPTGGGRMTTDGNPKGDGWGRITWGGDLNTVLACDRHRGILCDIRTNTASPAIDLPTDRDRSWILDLQRGPTKCDNHNAFILTSSDITWVDIRQPGRALLSWPHRRHRDDISMYLELFNSGDVTTAVIGSRLNFLTTCYQFSLGKNLQQRPTMLGDPYMLSPPFFHEDPSSSAISMAILPCSLKKISSGPVSQYHEQGIDYFVGISIDKKMGVMQRLYSTQEGASGAQSNRAVKMVGAPKISASFIINSDDDAESADNANLLHEVVSKNRNGVSWSNRCRSHRRVNLSELYDSTFKEGEEILRTTQDSDTVNSIKGYCGKLSELLEIQAERGNLGISLLIDVRAPSLLFDKLSDLEIEIETLLNSIKIYDHYEIQSLTPDHVSRSLLASSNDFSGVSIQILYENLVNTRVTPLPQDIPGRVRLRRERLARLIATEVFLASKGISVKASLEQLTPPQVSHLTTSTASPDPSQGLPHSQGAARLDTNNEGSEPLLRLRAYAHVQTRISLPEGLGRVLESWKVGEDPQEFEFFVDPEEGVPRYRKDRKKIRKEKNQILAGRAIPDLIGGSQPPALANGAMSSQIPQSQITASQIEKGKHGGRKPKKRKTGF